jgi:hypothetical protein
MQMQYLLVENKQTVLLGPIFWRHRFIQNELDDLDIDYTVPPVEPNAYLKITDNIEVYPIAAITSDPIDTRFEQLAGPFWNFDNQIATGHYTTAPKSLDTIKSEFLQLTANERYRKEIAGAQVTVQDTVVTVDTSRDGRNIFVQKYTLMSDTDTVQWKFPETWLTLTRSELGTVVAAGAAHIQSQFDWESAIAAQITSAATVDDLRSIVIVEPAVTPGVV